MKNIILYTAILSLFSLQSFAKISDELFFTPAATIEYSAPVLSGGGVNSEFTTNNFGKQMSHFQNIALGANFRVHKFLGFNANWAQTELKNDSLQNIGSLSQEARFKLNQYNFSLLAYMPIDKRFELFAEGGVADVNSKLTYVTSAGLSVNNKAHETMGLYGLGFQAKLCENADDAIRVSFQKYTGKLALTNTYYTTVRIGYLKAF